MTIRAHFIFAGALLAAAPTAPVIAFAQEATPSCMCPVALTQSSAAVGSIASLSGSVLVSHTASFVAAEQNAPLSAGSRVVTGNKSSARLLVGGCSVDLGANSSATIVRQEQQLCVRVLDQQKTAAVGGQTLDSRQAQYGQSGPTNGSRFGAPEGLAAGAFLGAGGAALLDNKDDDDDQCVSDC